MVDSPAQNNEAYKLLLDKYQNMLEKDPLTGLYNQRGFYTHTYNLLHENKNNRYIIACLNIYKFKVINDLFSINAGDELLTYIARNLKSFVQDKGTVARLGADNFAFCIPYEDIDYEKMMNVFDSWMEDYPLGFKIYLYCGIYEIHDLEVPVSIMCDRANMAILEIKGSIDRRYFVYDENIRKRILEEQEVLNDMKAALLDHQFVPYYQPKFNMESGKLIGAEALVRWIHPEKGMISPGLFIPVFEKNGFISFLDQDVWESVCRDVSEWLKKGYKVVPISINVSRAELYNRDLAKIILELIKKYDIPIELIQLEITESAYMENSDQIIAIVNQLKEQGFKILMDDFGSGYSSLNTLKDVPVDVLKLDLKFLYNMENNVKANYILKSVVQMAKRLSLSVIAEGVETEQQAEFLQSIGCIRAQGYLYSKPIPKDSFESYLADGSMVSINDEEAVIGIANFDDVLSKFHRDDEIEWYRNAMYQVHAKLYEYDIENDILTIYDMQNHDNPDEFSKLEIPNAINALRESDFIYEADREKCVSALVNRDITPIEIRIDSLMNDKGYRWYRQMGNIRYSQEGKPISIIGTLADISREVNENAMLQLLTIFEDAKSDEQAYKEALRLVADTMSSNFAGMIIPYSRRSQAEGTIYIKDNQFFSNKNRELLKKIDGIFLDYLEDDDQVCIVNRDTFRNADEEFKKIFVTDKTESIIFKRSVIKNDFVVLFVVTSDVYKTMSEGAKIRFGEIFKSLTSHIARRFAEEEDSENFTMYRLAFDKSDTYLWEYNIEERSMHRSVNVAALDGLGEWMMNLPESAMEYIHPDYRDKYIKCFEQLNRGEDTTMMVKKLHKDGKYHWLRIEFNIIKDFSGKPIKAIGNGEDIDYIFRCQASVRNRIREDILDKPHSFNWFSADLTTDEMLDCSPNLKIKPGESYQETVDIITNEYIEEGYRDNFYNTACRENLLKGYKENILVHWCIYGYKMEFCQGVEQFRENNISLHEDENGHVILFSIMTSATQKHKYAGYLNGEFSFDTQHGDLNVVCKDSFEKMVKAIMEKHRNENSALLLLDMDRFMVLTNTFGKAYSDEILANVVASIRIHLPEQVFMGVVFRDRFAVFIPEGESIKDIYRLANAIQKSIYSSFNVGGKNYVLAASMGISFAADEDYDYDRMMQKAEEEVKHIKRMGM